MRPLAHVVGDHHGDIPVAAIDGEIDASNTADVGQRLRGLITNRGEALVVDLVETSYIDSAGINLLFGLVDELRQRQQRLLLVVGEPSPIARMLAIAGLDVAVPIHPTREAALREAAGN